MMTKTAQAKGAWYHALLLMLMAAAMASFGVSASAETRSRVGDFAGKWGCHAQDNFSPLQFIQIGNIEISGNGQLSGFIIQDQPDPPTEIRCSVTGEASKAPREGYLLLNQELRCEIVRGTPVDLPVLEATGECVGVLETQKSGFNGMYCIDVTDEPGGFTATALGLCERQ